MTHKLYYSVQNDTHPAELSVSWFISLILVVFIQDYPFFNLTILFHEVIIFSIQDDPFFKKFRKLNEAMAGIVEDYSLVSFVALTVKVSRRFLCVHTMKFAWMNVCRITTGCWVLILIVDQISDVWTQLLFYSWCIHEPVLADELFHMAEQCSPFVSILVRTYSSHIISVRPYYYLKRDGTLVKFYDVRT